MTASRGRDTGSAQTAQRVSRLYGATRLEPYQQGELDYFCGMYAIINALRLSLATVRPLGAAQATELLKHGLAYLNEQGRMPLCKRSGLSVGSWHRIAAELARKAGQGAAVSIKPWRLFRARQHVSLREVLETVEMMIDEGSPVLLLLEATNRHFTVVSGYTPKRLWLFDSSGQSWINRTSCDTIRRPDAIYQIHAGSLIALRLQ